MAPSWGQEPSSLGGHLGAAQLEGPAAAPSHVGALGSGLTASEMLSKRKIHNSS